jgi:2-oxoisovalerate dehydrogenase E1 component
MLITCAEAALVDGSVCVFLEPIALYHARDLHEDGDDGWVSALSDEHVPVGTARTHLDGDDLTLVTWANGLHLSLRVARRLERRGIRVRVLDLRWLAPLPVGVVGEIAGRFPAVLAVDETRRSGGVSEGVVTGLVDGGYAGRLARVTSADSYVPLGPAASTVLLSEDDVIAAALQVAGPAADG